MICAMVFLFFIFNSRVSVRTQAYIYAIVAWTLFMFGITEILSFFHLLTTGGLWLTWGILDIILFMICLKGHMFKCYRIKVNEIPKSIICIVLFLLCVLFLAVKTVPYNWDSMTYHLGRIVHWHQNQSVAHYATHISRQVASPVLGAFVNLNVYTMLNGNDRLLNLLQCFSYFTNGWLVYHIAHKLGCSAKYCIMACVLFFSAPIAFAEALTTQVDNYSAMYALCFVYLLLDFMHMEKKLAWNKYSVVQVITLGLCVSFGYLAKPSVGIAMLVYALWLLMVSILRRDSFLVVLKLIVVTIPGMVIVLIPEFLRNLQTFHALSAPIAGARQLVGSLHEKFLAVNFLKNFTFNMPSVWLYDSSSFIWKYVTRFASLLDIDINNEAISEDGGEFVVYEVQQYSHDRAINPVIVWLLIVTVVMLFIMVRKLRLKQLKGIKAGYYLASVFSFVVFCTILRWEPFVSRYMITYLALLCPAIAVVVEWFMKKLRVTESVESGFLCIIGFCILVEALGMLCYHGRIAFGNYEGRTEGYFATRNYDYDTYNSAAEYIRQKNILEIGLLIGGDTYEYPLWKMIGHYNRIEHVNVGNDTGIYEDWGFVPDALLVINSQVDNGIEYHGLAYELTWQCDNIQVFESIQQ